MSTTTSNLGLFKYNVETDSHLAFNINTALNQNWDKIDEFAKSQIVPIATTETAGIVKPDGTTITVQADGTISSVIGNVYANKDLQNLSTLGNSRLQYAPFSINNGLVNSLGQNITFNSPTSSEITIICYPCTLTTADGRTFVDSEARTQDVSAGENNVNYAAFKNVITNELIAIWAPRFIISATAPSSPANGMFWLDTSTIPANFKIYDGTNWNINNNLVWIGNFIKTNNVVTTIKNRKFNDSGYLVDRHIDGAVETYVNGTSWYRIYSDGWCEQGGQAVTTGNLHTINLLKTFKNANYAISTTVVNLTNSGFQVTVSTRNTDSFSAMYFTAQGDVPFSWQASGYLA